MPDADQVLMQRFQGGDDSAFEVLVHKYQGMVLALARRYLGSRYQGLEDVAQKVFVRIYKARMSYEPRAKVKTWFYAITVNACLNEIRHLRTEKNRAVNSFTAVFGERAADDGPLEFEDPSAVAVPDLDEGHVAQRIKRAVDALPEQQRLALVLSRFHHCSYQEVAEAMSTSIPAVKSLLTRARQNLKQRLADLVEAELPAAAGTRESAGTGSKGGNPA